jgi:hypothetical protein
MPIEEIIKTGESDTVEFKTSFNKEVGFIERWRLLLDEATFTDNL